MDKEKKSEIVIYSYKTTTQLSKEIINEFQKKVSHFKIREGEVRWSVFPDGYPNLFVSEAEELKGKKVIFLASFGEYSSLFEQISVLFSLPRFSIKSLFIVLSYFPTGTMERVDTEGQIATAKSLARILSSIPLTHTGPPILFIYDIHCLQERFYFSDSILPSLHSAIPLFKTELFHLFPRYLLKLSSSATLLNYHDLDLNNPDDQLITEANNQTVDNNNDDIEEEEEEIAIAFPDEGACKRFSKFFPEFPEIITCSKVRQGNSRIVTIKDGDASGKHVFIVDDLVQTGGTLIECKDALFKHGAKKVSAYVTHAVFPNQSWRKFLPRNNGNDFTYFFTTNSIPETTNQLQNLSPFRVISIAPLIVENILTYL